MARRAPWAALAMTLFLPFTTPPATAGDACTDRLQVWLVARTGKERRTLNGTVELHPTSDRAVVMTVGFHQRGHARTFHDAAYSAYAIDNAGSPWPTVETTGGTPAPPVSSPGAPATALCAQPQVPAPGAKPTPVSLPMLQAPEPTDLSFYVLAYNDDVRLHLSPGWTAKKVSGGAVHTAVGATTAARARHISVEHFSGPATLEGGRWGSATLASLPCERLVSAAIAGGTGRGHLAGGDEGDGGPGGFAEQSRDMDCDMLNRRTSIATAHGPTHWTLTGEATGTSVVWFRLLVIDFPRP